MVTNQFLHLPARIARLRFAGCMSSAAVLGAGLMTGGFLQLSAEPFLTKTDLFSAGDGGYAVYHIPGIVVTAHGTVLAWGEARRAAGDWAEIDLLLRRSTDDGLTWGAPIRLPEVPGEKAKNPRSKMPAGAGFTYNNPVLIAGREGTVHALFCLEYQRCFYTRSADDGATWSTPVEITGAFEKFRQAYDWQVLATGPNHGLQLRSGRLLVPVWLSLGNGAGGHHPSVTATIYSDDQGATWQAGEIAVPRTAEWIDPNETAAAELTDGRVLLNVRNESAPNRRLITTSPDGATGWSTPRFDDALPEPVCMAGLLRLADGRLLFSNPDNLTRADGKEAPGKARDRRNLTLRVSADDGATWPVKKTLEPGPSGYSDLAQSAGTIFCFYVRPEHGSHLTLARFPAEWLTAQP